MVMRSTKEKQQRTGHNPSVPFSVCFLLQFNKQVLSTDSVHEKIRLIGNQLPFRSEEMPSNITFLIVFLDAFYLTP